ncbi:uncharacterized protein KY384_007690 [Bacidia gigantensis]|uniref:uncharacterized protein n=1 Tax=Bacidia gigantensis TaxID=2732470 RepID=UPI001D039E2D|nr:uncharacterized protein KY384_007690 [Bacidia gigantensis]KAG8527538.1 hypothetical protein KY384_007690 [Bacidia gigantensis]
MLLEERLPLYGTSGSEADEVNRGKHATDVHKRDLFESLPLSNGELETGWKELCVFEANGGLWRPGAHLLLNLWRSILTALALRGFDLGECIPTAPLEESSEEDGHPHSLLNAVIARLTSNGPDTHNSGTLLNAYVREDGTTNSRLQGNKA